MSIETMGYRIAYNRPRSTCTKVAPKFYWTANAALRDERRINAAGGVATILPATTASDGNMYYTDCARVRETLKLARKLAARAA